jgi:hypothetical protein
MRRFTFLTITALVVIFLYTQQSVQHVVKADNLSHCNDERDAIITEYSDFGVHLRPGCDDFTNNGHSDHFSFSELNRGDYSWAILRADLLNGLETVRTKNGGVPLKLNSGYRNPSHNAGVRGAATQSQHMYGTAADIASTEITWQTLHDHGKEANACVEPLDVSGPGHVHVDWRGHCPERW